MGWEVEVTDEFSEWWDSLTEEEQVDVAAYEEKLEQRGPTLPFPYSSGIKTSKHPKMRELRISSGGKPLRVFYSFDPRRMAILLIGGDKTGNKRFYEEFVPVADRLYDEHLRAIKREGIFKKASEQEQVHGGSSSILRTPGQNVARGTKTSGRKG